MPRRVAAHALQLRFTLGPGYEGSGGSQNFRSYCAQVSISQDAQWDAIGKVGIEPVNHA
jgi:hypothetical protein